jgi:hypothetical protein
MLIGTADEVPKAPEKAVLFVEDMSDEQAQSLIPVPLHNHLFIPLIF